MVRTYHKKTKQGKGDVSIALTPPFAQKPELQANFFKKTRHKATLTKPSVEITGKRLKERLREKESWLANGFSGSRTTP